MAENKDLSTGKKEELLVDDTSSEEETVAPEFRTIEEERRDTIPGSTQVTAMALMCSRAQVNPTVERGVPIKRYRKMNKNPQSRATVILSYRDDSKV